MINLIRGFRFGRLFSPGSVDAASRDRHLTAILRLLAVALAIVQVWTFRHDIKDVDGVSYLDMGEAYMRGDWATAINAMWSPFYGWVLGATIRLLQPSSVHEYLVVELVNLAIFLLAICGFEFFLRELLRNQRVSHSRAAQDAASRLGSSQLLLLGYSLFIWSSLFWITTWLQCPDMCVAAFVYVAAALCLRMRTGSIPAACFVAVGVVLGFAYLAKAAMFPLAFVFLSVTLFSMPDWRRAAPRFLTALVSFLLIAGPMIGWLSFTKGRFTFSDAGRINYIWHVNGRGSSWPRFPHWQKGIGSGAPLKPAAKIFDSPAVYQFPPNAKGTYPMWYDPTPYWEGVAPRWDLREQVANLKRQARTYLAFFLAGPQCVIVASFLLLSLISRRSILKDIFSQWRILLPACAAFAIYAVVHVEARYIGAFGVLFWLALFCGLRFREGSRSQRWRWCVTSGAAITVLIGTAIWVIRDAFRGEEFPTFNAVAQWHYAEQLEGLGLHQGEKVGIMGSALGAARWARLARVQIAAETPWTEMRKFWQADEATRARVVEVFATTGAKMIIAEKAPLDFAGSGWRRIGTTDDFAYVLDRKPHSPPREERRNAVGLNSDSSAPSR